MMKIIAGLMSPGGQRGRLSIFIFHRVLPQVDPLFPGEQTIARFNDTLSWIAQLFQVIPLDKAVTQLANGTLPARSAAITFDDGYADNATNALPVLQAHGITATFFVATSFLDGGRMWNDSVIEVVRGYRCKVLNLSDIGLGTHCLETLAQRRTAIDLLLGQIKYLGPQERQQAVAQLIEIAGAGSTLPNNLMMRSEQVQAMQKAGMQIGAHTCSHPILAKIPDEQAEVEITTSKIRLESLLDQRVDLFAYPNGKPEVDYFDRHVKMVREAGFVAAVSTAPGVALQPADAYQLPRFTPWDRTRFRFGIRTLANLYHGVHV